MTIRFGATIRFVSQATYEAATGEPGSLDERPLLHRFTWNEDQFVLGKHDGVRGLACCLGGGLANGLKASIMHLIPEGWMVQAFERDIEPELNDRLVQFQAQSVSPKAPISGLFMGGHNEADTGMETMPLFSKIKAVVDRLNLPVSYFIGCKTRGTSSMVYQPDSDTWLVYERNMGGGGDSAVHSMDDLQRRFSHVYVAPGDTVEFESQPSQ